MWSISGMAIIPTNPELTIAKTDTGTYLNFKIVTQGKSQTESPNYQYWDCSLWVPPSAEEEWKDKIAAGNVFYIEHGYATSYPILEGKYHNTKIRLSLDKFKQLSTPLWVKAEKQCQTTSKK